jgi:hypothetical protein
VSLLDLRCVFHRVGLVVVMVCGSWSVDKHAVIRANCGSHAVCSVVRSTVMMRYNRASDGSMNRRARRCPCVDDRGSVVVSM